MKKTGNTRILIVDDDAKYLSMLRRILRGAFEVTTTRDPVHALEIFEHKGPFAVVISDYRMPFMNGIDLFARIFALDKRVQRIMLTGHAELQMAIDAVNHGKITAFLTKPTPAVSIRSVVAEATRAYNLHLSRAFQEKTAAEEKTTGLVPLTVKEKEVLCLLTKGCSNYEISRALHVTVGTVKSHMNNLFTKMEVNSRSKVVAKALRLGLINL